MAEEVGVVIVGAGPAGLATSACLNKLSIPNIVLERDDCIASLWKKRAYDRLKLHLGKEFCSLPHMPFPPDAPTFVPRIDFLRYLDNYVSHFRIQIKCNKSVESAFVDDGKWRIIVKDTSLNVDEVYLTDFLVVATGENSEGFIPDLDGLDSFEGEYLHCNKYLNGREWYGKNVLVVGCGNSGMEIAYDLFNWGVNTSIVVKNPVIDITKKRELGIHLVSFDGIEHKVHIVTKEMVYLGMHLLNYIGVEKVDKLINLLSELTFGNLSKFGFSKPSEGPFFLKAKTGRSPTIDVGAMAKIKEGKIKVFPGISRLEGDKIVEFDDGRKEQFDCIIFATGYRSTVLKWLKDYEELFNENGMPKRSHPDHWKGANGLYCAGFGQRGLNGISFDAQRIANDISRALDYKKNGSQFL